MIQLTSVILPPPSMQHYEEPGCTVMSSFFVNSSIIDTSLVRLTSFFCGSDTRKVLEAIHPTCLISVIDVGT